MNNPSGTSYSLAQEAKQRKEIIDSLEKLYSSWGYQKIDTPVLEHYDENHPRKEQSFKLSDKDSGVLTLRSDFTPAIAKMVRAELDTKTPYRFQYSGKVWQAINPDISRTREFTQIGLELINISNARADAELINLARESVRIVGLKPKMEIGNPGFVRAIFALADIPAKLTIKLANAIDRKDHASIKLLIEPLGLAKDLHNALIKLVDLYGDRNTLKEAHKIAPWPETTAELDRLDEVLEEFNDSRDLLVDLGIARRLSYYTSMTFRAYTYDFGSPLLGGGRYDGALLPYSAGFSIGLERLLAALPETQVNNKSFVLSLDDKRANVLRSAGYVVERSLTDDIDLARKTAKEKGISYLLTLDGLEPILNDPCLKTLESILNEN